MVSLELSLERCDVSSLTNVTRHYIITSNLHQSPNGITIASSIHPYSPQNRNKT